MTSSFNWRPLKKSKLLSKGEEDPRDYRYISRHYWYNALVRSQILPDYNMHGAFEGHGKEAVTGKVSDPPFTKEVTATKNSCSLDDFLVAELPIKRKIMAL